VNCDRGWCILVHGMGPKSCREMTPATSRCKSRRNSRIADIANMPLAFNFEVVNLRLERFAHLGSGAEKSMRMPLG